MNMLGLSLCDVSDGCYFVGHKVAFENAGLHEWAIADKAARSIDVSSGGLVWYDLVYGISSRTLCKRPGVE